MALCVKKSSKAQSQLSRNDGRVSGWGLNIHIKKKRGVDGAKTLQGNNFTVRMDHAGVLSKIAADYGGKCQGKAHGFWGVNIVDVASGRRECEAEEIHFTS